MKERGERNILRGEAIYQCRQQSMGARNNECFPLFDWNDRRTNSLSNIELRVRWKMSECGSRYKDFDEGDI